MKVACTVTITVDVGRATEDDEWEDAITDELDKVISAAYDLDDYYPWSPAGSSE